MRIEHELGAADGLMSAQPGSRQIKKKDGLKHQQADRLPREEHRALRPERNRNQEIAEVAKEQKILHAILLPINRRPTEHEDRPDDLEPEGQAHAEHCTSELESFELRASSHELRASSFEPRDSRPEVPPPVQPLKVRIGHAFQPHRIESLKRPSRSQRFSPLSAFSI